MSSGKGPQLAKGLEDGIGGGLLTDAGGLVLAYSHLNIGEEVGDELLRGSHHLVADHRQPTTTLLQFVNGLHDAVVRPCSVQ